MKACWRSHSESVSWLELELRFLILMLVGEGDAAALREIPSISSLSSHLYSSLQICLLALCLVHVPRLKILPLDDGVGAGKIQKQPVLMLSLQPPLTAKPVRSRGGCKGKPHSRNLMCDYVNVCTQVHICLHVYVDGAHEYVLQRKSQGRTVLWE